MRTVQKLCDSFDFFAQLCMQIYHHLGQFPVNAFKVARFEGFRVAKGMPDGCNVLRLRSSPSQTMFQLESCKAPFNKDCKIPRPPGSQRNEGCQVPRLLSQDVDYIGVILGRKRSQYGSSTHCIQMVQMVILAVGIMEKKMETTIIYWGYNGIMEEKMETTIIYWGYNGIMEKKMETT